MKVIDKLKCMKWYVLFLFGAFSALLSGVMILGNHIHVENSYSGLMSENYITPYSMKDCTMFFCYTLIIFVIVTSLYFLIVKREKTEKFQFSVDEKIPYKWIIGTAVILFVLWIPYLVVYYPGFVFGDTFSSLAQIFGWEPLNNHFPVCYTVFIKCCLEIGNLFGGNTAGCVIYCVLQMSYMSLCLAYLTCWLYVRAHLKRIWPIILVVFYGCVPYFAQMSIAMWKDPVFSVTIVVITLKLADLVLTRGCVLCVDKCFLIKYMFLLLIMIFTRNNGIYISFFMGISFLFMWIIHKKDIMRFCLKKMTVVTATVIFFSLIITGPVYDKLGIAKETVESYGVFLNQMARVVAYNGNMSDEDKEYMNQLLPLEMYKTTYYPCCVDLLKWNPHFDSSALEQGFFKRYISMFLKNPRIFFEAWELQTYGFWTVNCDEINYYTNNIEAGVPLNYYPDIYRESLDVCGIKEGKYINNDFLNNIFPIRGVAIPIGIISWFIFLTIIFLVLRRKELLLLTLTPTIGLILTLVIASPISYWPRYAAAEQYLIPFYIVLLVFDIKYQGRVGVEEEKCYE